MKITAATYVARVGFAGRLERVRFELNHDRALSFCFDAFSSNAFSSDENSPVVNDWYGSLI
jgi:hypothetical protein